MPKCMHLRITTAAMQEMCHVLLYLCLLRQLHKFSLSLSLCPVDQHHHLPLFGYRKGIADSALSSKPSFSVSVLVNNTLIQLDGSQAIATHPLCPPTHTLCTPTHHHSRTRGSLSLAAVELS